MVQLATFPETRTHLLPGMVHGETQPTLLANFEVVPAAAPRLERFDTFLDARVEEPVPPDAPGDTAAMRIARRVMHASGAMQRQQKIPAFGPGRLLLAKPRERGVFVLFALPWHEARASRLVLDWAMEAIDALAGPGGERETARMAAAFDRCVEQLRPYSLDGISNFHFLRTAHALGIPAARWLSDLYCFGHGCHAKLMQRSLTEHTPALGAGMARRKSHTAIVLRRAGVPVPDHMRVAGEQEALSAAATLGYPVVVKPDDQEQGRGVAAGLRDAPSVAAAYAAASALSKAILVEKHHEGQDYRLTVFRGQVVKILHRRACGVTGDGTSTVAALVERAQRTPRFQGVLLREGRMLMVLDEEALGCLKDQDLDAASVPAEGRFVALKRKANISAGGTQTLVPVAHCHPDNAALAARACAALRLDLCGVDLLIPDISQSWLQTGAVIIELNAQPQIGWNLGPEAYATVLTGLMQGHWHIPLRLVICAAGRGPASLEGVQRLFPGFDANGWSCPDGVWIDGAQVTKAPADGFHAAGVLLGDTRVRAAGIVMTLEELSRCGLPAARFEALHVLRPETLSAIEKSRWDWAESLLRDCASPAVPA